MKVTIVDPVMDRKIITWMITSTPYLQMVHRSYADPFLETEYARMVARWCIRYFKKYALAPNKIIQDIYDSEVARGHVKPEVAEMIATYLHNASDKFDQENDKNANVEFMVDETLAHWKKQNLEEHLRNTSDLLAVAGANEADELMRQYRTISTIAQKGYLPLKDDDAVDRVFAQQSEPLFHFPGAIGALLNRGMVRGGCIGAMGPMKSGKTYFLLEAAIRACISRLNVAVFELGDMSESEIDSRLYSNLSGLPNLARYVGNSLVPELDCRFNQYGGCPKQQAPNQTPVQSPNMYALPTMGDDYQLCPYMEKCEYCKPTVTRMPHCWPRQMERTDVLAARATLSRHMRTSNLRFFNAPNNTYTADMIEEDLQDCKERFDFVPDVICIDYDGTLKRETGAKDGRESYIAQWKGFRKLSQTWHALVLVATQTNADGMDREDLILDNFSGSVEKYAHATAMLAIHGTRKELNMGLCRMSWAMGRTEALSIDQQVVVLRHLSINRPMVGSFWRNSDYRPKQLAGDTPQE